MQPNRAYVVAPETLAKTATQPTASVVIFLVVGIVVLGCALCFTYKYFSTPAVQSAPATAGTLSEMVL